MAQEDKNIRVVRPGQTIGILGGGQLGRMMALEARKMGYRIVTLDPTPDSPCGQVSDRQIVAPYSDVEAARQLALESDVITYEFENVDAAVTRVLEAESYVPQGSTLLFTTQHRLREKAAIEGAGVSVAPYRPIASWSDLESAIANLGLPAVLKTTTGGYDGKGQWTLRSNDDALAAWESFVAANGALGEGQGGLSAPLVLEQFVPFEREVSVIVARSTRGEVRTFPVAENIHREHILHESIVPARISSDLAAEAQRVGERIAEALSVVGLIAVEMFVTRDGKLFVNELAPRPHNSGHYTYDACETSQFEQHVRAVCGLPLGDTRLTSPVVMVNILGEHMEAAVAAAAHLPTRAKLHLYGKRGAAAKRKMGHLCILAEDVERALGEIAEMGLWR